MANEKELAKASSHAGRAERERKVGMSCAECRRLVAFLHTVWSGLVSRGVSIRSKLKCDRTFPCSVRLPFRQCSTPGKRGLHSLQACIRRGCANICPDGRFILTVFIMGYLYCIAAGTLTATRGNK